MVTISKEELIQFEKDVKQMFLDGKLRSPVHLSGGNEDQLIEIFKQIKPNDWVFTTYRSHYHALLKGVPKDKLNKWVLDNKSIHFMDKEYKIFSSAIVGGCLPIALGTAMAIKRKEEEILREINKSNEGMPLENIELLDKEHVYCFVGDMTASLGVFKDCLMYAVNHSLPITFVIEDNGLSTDTKTSEVWNADISKQLERTAHKLPYAHHIKYYKYERIYSHYGVGVFVDFNEDNKIKQDKGF